jgi:hypothetical protein
VRDDEKETMLTPRQNVSSDSARGDQPLIDTRVEGRVASEIEADPVIALAGVWSDLSWEDIAATLDRIRHEGKPTPPLSL